MDKTCASDSNSACVMDEEWPEDDFAIEAWAEAGGYAAGLPRPLASHERLTRLQPTQTTAQCDWEDIPF